ncbi:MAG TPA: cytochrome c peroxidase [Candidatus Limnocylindrales bacterium]|nr:cytochrome c peroxidase [Candidatus Limnocylindrales bacterium]
MPHRSRSATLVLLLLLPAAAAAGVRLDEEQRLGRLLYKDRDLSVGRNQACASCHRLGKVRNEDGMRLPAPGFVDGANVRTGSAVSRGSVAGRFGTLNSPSAGYAAFSPAFHWNEDQQTYVGGQFWNGRASTLAEQAAAPFLNPAEMAMPSKWAVVTRLAQNNGYVERFEAVYGIDLSTIPQQELAPAEATAPGGVDDAYDRMTRAIAAFEKSRRFARFTSKFDFYLAGMTELTAQEAEGLEVFELGSKGNCSACHPSTPGTASDGSLFPPLFTDFRYDNLGLPRNVNIPGDPAPDAGLGGRADIAEVDPEGLERGKHKVMSLRNIAITPPYGHNGVFATLEQIVHFYNTRDTLGTVADNNRPGFGKTGWPPPEISQNVNVTELGSLGLTPAEEDALVAFLETLTDGYPEWGNDPLVPPGTRSPFRNTPLPEFP